MRYESIILKQIDEGFRDITSLGSLMACFILFLILLIVNLKRASILFVGVALIEIVGSIIKLKFHKARPNKQFYSNLIEKIDAGSFPSIHSARALVLGLSLYPLVSSKILIGLIFALVFIVGLSRIYLKKHFITDIIGGYILGFVCWYLVSIIL